MKTKAINQHRQGRRPPQRISTLVCGARALLRNNHGPCLITSTNCASKAAVHFLALDILLTLDSKLRGMPPMFPVWKITQRIMMHSNGALAFLSILHTRLMLPASLYKLVLQYSRLVLVIRPLSSVLSRTLMHIFTGSVFGLWLDKLKILDPD